MIAFIGNLFGPDGILIMFVVLMFFGAKRMPELARSLGQAMREFSQAKNDFTDHLMSPPLERPLPSPDVQNSAPVQAPESKETPV